MKMMENIKYDLKSFQSLQVEASVFFFSQWSPNFPDERHNVIHSQSFSQNAMQTIIYLHLWRQPSHDVQMWANHLALCNLFPVIKRWLQSRP